MSKINGTQLLVYANGVLIAAQKSCTVSWEQDLPGASTKDSSGWEEHINGTRRCTCDFDGLYSTTGLTADGLISFILSRSNIVLLIDGGGFPIVGEATPKGVTIGAANEEAATISGSFKFNGPAWMLTGAYVNLINNPNPGEANTYDTLTVSGISITSAVNNAGDALFVTNSFAGGAASQTYKLITFLDVTSGQAPVASLVTAAGTGSSNEVTMNDGVNVQTFVTTDTPARLQVKNTAASAWNCQNIYLFKV